MKIFNWLINCIKSIILIDESIKLNWIINVLEKSDNNTKLNN